MPVGCREHSSLLFSLSSASFMVSVLLQLSVLCVPVISETDVGLVNGFGVRRLSGKEPDMVEGVQSPKPDC